MGKIMTADYPKTGSNQDGTDSKSAKAEMFNTRARTLSIAISAACGQINQLFSSFFFLTTE